MYNQFCRLYILNLPTNKWDLVGKAQILVFDKKTTKQKFNIKV
jgi:hypothetical protein